LRLVEAVDLLQFLAQPFLVQAVGHGDAPRVIGDGDVFVAQVTGGAGHVFDGIAPVGVGAVHVQIAADPLLGDEFGQASGLRRLDLAPVLP